MLSVCADHYKYVFTRIFDERKFQRIIILEGTVFLKLYRPAELFVC